MQELQMNDKTATSLYLVAGVVLPGAIMFGARYFGQGTSNVKANQASTPIPKMVVVPDVSLIAEQDIGDQHDTDQAIESPFWFEVEDFNSLLDPFANLLEPDPGQQPMEMDFSVSTILPSAKNPLAVINSKPYRIGDDVGYGWKLEGIDGKKRTVVLLHNSGKRITLEMATK